MTAGSNNGVHTQLVSCYSEQTMIKSTYLDTQIAHVLMHKSLLHLATTELIIESN